MKKILPTLGLIFLIIVAILVGANYAGADMSFLTEPFNCASKDTANVESEQDGLTVFAGKFQFNMLENNKGVITPTFSGILATSELPEKYYISYNDEVEELPEGCYTYTKYPTYYEVHFEGELLYDRINAGTQLATFYAHYKNGDKMRKIDETQVVINEYLFYGDYLSKQGMYYDSYSADENISTSFELVRKGFVYPTLDMKLYLGKLPSSVQVALQGQTVELGVNDFSVINHGTYYELTINKVIIFKKIAKGVGKLEIDVLFNDAVIREDSVDFNSKHEYYSTKAVNWETKEVITAMDSDDFWIGPY